MSMKRIFIVSTLALLVFLSFLWFSVEVTTSDESVSLTLLTEPLLKPSDARFIGSDRCQYCHPTQYQHWRGTSHARAWERVAKNSANLDCARCHATGSEYQGGFTSPEKTPDLLHVQCEACHGPAELHVQKREQSLDDDFTCCECDIKKVCIACHTISRSPKFDMEQSFKRIRHPK